MNFKEYLKQNLNESNTYDWGKNPPLMDDVKNYKKSDFIISQDGNKYKIDDVEFLKSGESKIYLTNTKNNKKYVSTADGISQI